MLTYNEIIELRKQLLKGEIALESAKELYWKDFKDGKRSWHTKDWKERRAEVIKDKCEICSSEETLTLQHRSHPKKYYDWEKEVTKEYTNAFIESNPTIYKSEFVEHIRSNYNYEPVPLCPYCKSRRPNLRTSKSPQYLCTECRHEFDDTIHKSVEELVSTFYENEEATEVRDKCFVSKKWSKKNNLSNVRYWFLRELTRNRNNEAIEKVAFLLYLDDTIKYLSFEDTLTACKKCASSFDLYNLELCPKCKEYYKGVDYQTCIQCLPEEKRKAALEKIEYGKEMRELHKRLGID